MLHTNFIADRTAQRRQSARLARSGVRLTVLAGPSGCGKTTLVKLLLGLYAPNGGVVSVDGIPINELRYNRVRRQIGAQTAVLAGLDALVFSAGDGFDDPALREQIVAGLAYLGLGDRVPVLTTSLTPLLATALVAGA